MHHFDALLPAMPCARQDPQRSIESGDSPRLRAPGGNWLRISAVGETEEDGSDSGGRLDRVLLNAARQGDARGMTPGERGHLAADLANAAELRASL
ncbi:hypothetical protein [Paenarthrobacter sp. FR1]|uniref:hypothetical protein n=1 Tax=Paenarthrobacter sp. FR1 TaxID=3439548 RepID=UPI003DA40FDD